MRKAITIAYLICLGLTVQAQQKLSLPFGSRYDEEAIISVGISYSYVNVRYLPTLVPEWHESDIIIQPNHLHNLENLQSITSPTRHGAAVGIPIDLRLTENWYVTFHPNFIFINHATIRYSGQPTLHANTGSETDNGLVNDGPYVDLVHHDRQLRHSNTQLGGSNFNSLEFPLHVKYRSEEKQLLNKYNRYRGYLLAGAKLTRWLGIDREYYNLRNNQGNTTPRSIALIARPEFISWDVGVGTEIFFQHFRVSPEIRFSQSFRNVLDNIHGLNQGNPYMERLDKALFRNVSFSLIFQ